MQKNYCVIGAPIAHSLSPLIHNTLYEIYGLDCFYDKHMVTPETLTDFLATLDDRKIAGFNITMPLKQEIIPFLAVLSPEAKTSVNTVAVRPDGLHGYSTDALGFYASLLQIGMAYRDKNIVFIGAGAVTELLCADAVKKGAKHIAILNRTVEKAQKIAQAVDARSDSLAHIDAYMKDCDLLINTTPLGMSGASGDFTSLDFIGLLPAHAAVCDLIYSPAQTSLLKRADASRLKTMNGLGMLIWQAFYSFEKWFDIMPSKRDYEIVSAKLTAVLATK